MDRKTNGKKSDKSISLESNKSEKCSDKSKSNLDCGCEDHIGNVYLDKIFEIPIDHLYECLFGLNEFFFEFSRKRKISDLVIGEWKNEILNGNEIQTRKLEYTVPLNGTFAGSKSCKTIVHEKILTSVPTSMYVVDSESFSSGVLYADCFKVNTRFCLTSQSSSLTKLLIHSAIQYINKPNFIIKGIIEKTCDTSFKEHYKELDTLLTEYSEKISNTRMLEKIKKSSLPRSSSSSLNISSENEYSPDEMQAEANFYISNHNTNSENSTLSSNLKYNIATIEKIEIAQERIPILIETNVSNPNHEKTVVAKKRKDPKVESKNKKIIAHVESNENSKYTDKHNCYKYKHSKSQALSSSNTKICPNCQSLKNTLNYDQKDFLILSKDMIMKILLIVMVIVIFLNIILYEKLANLEKIANSLKIKSENKFRSSFK